MQTVLTRPRTCTGACLDHALGLDWITNVNMTAACTCRVAEGKCRFLAPGCPPDSNTFPLEPFSGVATGPACKSSTFVKIEQKVIMHL